MKKPTLKCGEMRYLTGVLLLEQDSPSAGKDQLIDLALGLGRLGTLNDGLVQQTYGSIKIGFNFHDYWFIKRRFD